MRQFLAEVGLYAVLKQDGRLPRALQHDALESCSPALVSVSRFAFMNKTHGAQIFFTVWKMKILREMACFCRAYYYSKEQKAKGKGEGFF